MNAGEPDHRGVRASIRSLWGEERPATIIDLRHEDPTLTMVALDRFGHLFVNCKDGVWQAAVAQMRNGTLSVVKRGVRVEGDRIEVELLPNPSGEERIVVVLRGLKETAAEGGE